MALPKEKLETIERLLREGKLSKRAISRQEGISRITIDRLEKKFLFPGESPPPANKPESYIRCKGCGGKVLATIPCLVCQLQRKQVKDYDIFMDSLLTPVQVTEPSPKLKRKRHEKKGRQK